MPGKKKPHLDTCLECGSMCCTYFCLEIPGPRSRRDFEDLRWYVCHENCRVYRSDGTWHLLVENRCRNLRDDGRCAAYENRPAICREYEPEACEGSGDFDFDVMFSVPEDVERYMTNLFLKKGKRARRGRYVPPRNKQKKKPAGT